MTIRSSPTGSRSQINQQLSAGREHHCWARRCNDDDRLAVADQLETFMNGERLA